MYQLATATLIVFSMAILNSILQKVIVNVRKAKRLVAEINRWEKMRREAIQRKNKKLFQRVERERKRIDKMKFEVDKERLKTYFVSFGLWILGMKLAEILLPSGFRIYVPPLNIETGFIGWYIMVSLWLFPLLIRVIAQEVYEVIYYARK